MQTNIKVPDVLMKEMKEKLKWKMYIYIQKSHQNLS